MHVLQHLRRVYIHTDDILGSILDITPFVAVLSFRVYSSGLIIGILYCGWFILTIVGIVRCCCGFHFLSFILIGEDLTLFGIPNRLLVFFTP